MRWINVELAIAALGCLVLALGHTAIGLRWVLPNLTKGRLPSTPVGPPSMTFGMVGFTWQVLSVVVAAASLVGRFRRARGIERQQLGWVALAAAVVSLAAALVLAAMLTETPALCGWGLGLCAAILPLAIGAAILRYRLYDLDRIISRTLTYGLLTLVLGLSYAALVLGLGQLLGRDSSLAVAAATLAAAAAFHPTRRRIQQSVDRRFNRRRHDATQRIAAFNDHLRAQVDLDTLTVELLAVAGEIMQPTQASLWLRPPDERLRPTGT